ncbi:MAG: hypothetical protein A3K45_01635 [Chloroflexi bacterium RIFOXYC12_FULL_59_14]|nr:MAG: hypothetical protein A3K45_01635 [Chloroflexi bacterium RIFOXYC12_FULL_59_14]
MIGWFRKNFSSLLWALLLSVAVWIAAVTAADPDDQRVYPKPVPIEIVGQGSGLVIVGEMPKAVEVTLRAPRSVWDRLEGQEQPIRAVVDLSGLGAGEHPVRVQVQVSENPARVVSVLPTDFTVTLEPLTSRVFPVGLTLNGQPATGYRAGNPTLEPLEVLVSGAESLVEQVARARVIVNLAGTRESLNQEMDVQLYNANNQALKGLSLNPSAVLVDIPVSQQGGYRDVAVKVIVQGQVANGYLLTDLSVFPPIVTVYSTDPGLVNALPGIVETQTLELRGASEDISTRLALNLPAGVSVVGEQSVQVDVSENPARVVSVLPTDFTVTLEPLTSRVFPVGLTLNGQPATGYRAGNPTLEPLEVLVSGAESLVEQVARARVIVNLAGTRESLNQEMDVQLYNANNQALKGLSLNPSAVLVDIPVSQQGGYRDVAVKVIVQGQVANGYLLTDLSVFPPIVTVYSTDPGLVNALPGIVETQTLELRGASEDISTRLALNLPAGVSVVGEQSVQVDVGISPIQSNLTLVNIKIEVVGLGDGLSAQISPAEVDIILSGPAPLLESLLQQDVRVIVDVTELLPGIYQLKPRVEILVADIVVETILPNTVEVTITPAVTPTPSQ